MSDIDFEEIGFSDGESVSGTTVTTQKVVLLDLPKDFVESAHATSDRSEAESSFTPVGKLASLKLQSDRVSSVDVRKPAAHDFSCDDDSSWSQVAGKASASVAAGSTISGFDVLSLGGGSIRLCKHCTYLNAGFASSCIICGFPLVANPSLDTDSQIAASLQLQEEQCLWNAEEEKEKKRKALAQMPLLAQGRHLSEQVVQFVSQYHNLGFSALPVPSLTILATRFIDCVQELNSTRVMLSYHFSANTYSRMTQIRQDGFGPLARTSENMEVAFRYFGRVSTGQMARTTPTILENCCEATGRRSDLLGWIVATVRRGNEYLVPAPSGSARVQEAAESRHIFPLVAFDASLRGRDEIRALRNGLATICNDVFDALKVTEFAVDTFTCPVSPNKKAKSNDWLERLADAPNPFAPPPLAPATIDPPEEDNPLDTDAQLLLDTLTENSSQQQLPIVGSANDNPVPSDDSDAAINASIGRLLAGAWSLPDEQVSNGQGAP